MTTLVVDSCVVIRFLGQPMDRSMRLLANYDRLLVPSIVSGEVSAGFFDTKQGNENKLRFFEFLSYPQIQSVPVTDRTAELYAKVYQALRKQGTPIPQNDMWIAASALEHGADLATYDEHFRLVPMLTAIVF